MNGRPICSRCAPSAVPAASCPRCQAVFRGAGRVCGSCSDFLRSGASSPKVGRSCPLPPKGKGRDGKAPNRNCIQCNCAKKGSLPRCKACYREFCSNYPVKDGPLREERAKIAKEMAEKAEKQHKARVAWLSGTCWTLEGMTVEGRTWVQCCYGDCRATHKGNGFCPGHQPPEDKLKSAVVAAKEILRKRRDGGPVTG